MAANDTAALVVALSAQISKFEKDMKGAVDIAAKRTKEIETRFEAMNKAITGKLSQLASSASSNLGFAGTVLSTLGPLGIAAATGIGAAVGGILLLANAAAEFSAKAVALKEGAETAGLTITQFKLLGQAGKQAGLDFDSTTAFFTKYIQNLEALRDGGGPLYDALLKIDTGLLRQLSTTKDSAQAIDILVAAFKRLDDQTKRLDLAKAAGGKGGLAGTRLLDDLGNKGGLSGLVANSPKIDEGQIDRAAALRKEIDAIAAKTANIWGGMFSDAILSNQKQARQELQAISEWIAKIVGSKERAARLSDPVGAEVSDLKAEKADLEKQTAALAAQLAQLAQSGADKNPMVIPAIKSLEQSYEGLVTRLKEVDAQLDKINPKLVPPPGAGAPAGPTVELPLPRARPEAAGSGSPSVELAIFQKNVALLGEAITAGEQWKLKKLEIAAATEKGGISDGVAQRALDAFRVTMIAAANATRERLGIATQDQIVEARLAQLSQDRAKFGLTENEVDRAKVVILREAKEAADALTVRQAYLPGLKQLELDAGNVRKGLDTLATQSLSHLENGLVDLVTGTKTAAEAFKSMALSILSDLARLAIRQIIVAPLAGALGLKVPTFASGTDFAPGGMSVVGENGPELINLPRGSQVVPNGIASSGSSNSGFVYAPSYHFDAGIGPADMALINAQIRMSEQRTRNDVVAITRGTLRNDREALNR